MEKAIGNKLSIIVKVCALFAAIMCGTMVCWAFSPSVDGRATVAPLGELPQGMFAKTVGYLPGDSITVTNLTTHNTVDILVVGALDASQGIAISLSPEAAMMLDIKAGSDVMVKLTRRNGTMDEVVTGSAVLTPGANGKSDIASVASNANGSEVASKAAQEGEIAMTKNAESTPTSDSAAIPPTEDTHPNDKAVPNPPLAAADGASALEAERDGDESNLDEQAAPVASVTETAPNVPVPDGADTPMPVVGLLPVTETAVAKPASEAASQLLLAEDTLPAPVTETAPTPHGSGKASVQPVIEPATPPKEWVAALPLVETSSVDPEKLTPECNSEQLSVIESNASVAQSEVKGTPEAVAETDVQVPYTEVNAVPEAVAESDARAPNPEVKAVSEAVAESDARAPNPEVKAAPSVAIATDEVLPPPEMTEKEIEEIYPAETLVSPDTSFASSNELLQSIESYAPIVLVPTGSKVPEPAPEHPDNNSVISAAEPIETDKTQVEVAMSDQRVSTPSSNMSYAETGKESTAFKESAAIKEEPIPVIAKPAITDGNRMQLDDTLNSLTRQSISALDKGSYYVQFATFSSTARAKDALMKYGVDYPMAFVPSKKAATQAMIGPLTVDEYGAVLARFKSDGFGDAFLRKIK